jgi:hypothetical protein
MSLDQKLYRHLLILPTWRYNLKQPMSCPIIVVPAISNGDLLHIRQVIT